MAKEIIRQSGFAVSKLCNVFGVSKATVYNWMGDHPEFLDNIREGRRIWDGLNIERMLVKRATGFSYTETYKEADSDGNMKVTKTVKKYVAPDVAAIKHWQANVDPTRWSDKQNVEHSGAVDHNTTVMLNFEDVVKARERLSD